ncbi:MAG: hypothetical protein A3I10_03400 [Deltaproteobacteria bacterium RIFCSPLOWO2_02_FULL_57_26]|nr:MAG: hypothetical protein A3I10_03400 [Deltaproteobacteria bacterium RIFCSPLOWO2_02_FULL_57_26]
MDVLAHGLWGGVAFYPHGAKRFAAGLALGMAPDLLSFGLFHVSHPGWLSLRLAGQISGPPPLSILPEFVFHAYNLTHSLVVWAALFALIWALRKRPPWVFLAWSLHIVCDIPTHNSAYFPTPYLWPFPTPLVEGILWATPWFMITNYSALLAAYLGVALLARKLNLGRTEGGFSG